MVRPLFSRIAIIGLGLIGSSIARAAHERRLAKTIIGCDANEQSLAHARKEKFIDIVTQNASEAVAKSELIILATPPSALAEIAKIIAPHLEKNAIVMDVCSVKQAAIDAIAPQLPPGVEFIPAHPIAGSEQSGVEAGRGDLFEGRQVIMAPDKPEQTEALQKIFAFWQAIGACVEAMPAAAHDMVYAHVSHLPHLLAFAAAGVLTDYKNDKHVQTFLRLSGSNAALWAEIFLLNKDNVLAALDRYLDAVSHITEELNNSSPLEGGGQEGGDRKSANDSAPTLTLPLKGEGMVYTALFPRIAASCLITTVIRAERKSGFPFARYAGTGFADFTAPAAAPPEGDIEQISGQYAAVAKVLGEYIATLKRMRTMLAEGDVEKLEEVIAGGL